MLIIGEAGCEVCGKSVLVSQSLCKSKTDQETKKQKLIFFEHKNQRNKTDQENTFLKVCVHIYTHMQACTHYVKEQHTEKHMTF